MARKILTSSLVLIVVLGMIGCKKKAAIQGLDLEIAFSEERLSDNLVTDLQYKWKTSGEFENLGQDYSVFVHFWHKNNLLFQDNHNPEVPVSQWEPGKEYTYTRRIYIPIFIDEFDPNFRGEDTLKFSAGFVSPEDSKGESGQEILVEKLKVFPPPLDTPEVIYEEGWYDLEINPDAFLKQWRWTSQKARCIIDNPHRDALLIIKGGINANAFESQAVVFKINDLTLDEFIPEGGIFEKTYSIKKEMLGDKDEFYLTIETDKTFVPSELSTETLDDRVLGIQVSFIYFR